MSIGLPVKLLHEAEGHIITVETKKGELYRGYLEEAEDNMNLQMSKITLTLMDGSKHYLEKAYIRGSKIVFVVVPDMLKNAPMFKNITKPREQKGLGNGFGVGRGRSAQQRAVQSVGKSINKLM